MEDNNVLIENDTTENQNEGMEIVGLYRHNIIYKPVKNKLNIKSFSFLFVFMFITAIIYGISYVSAEFYETIQATMSSVYNPVNPLYNEHGGIFFASGKAHYGVFNEEREVVFNLPVMSSNIKFEENYITFTIENSVVVVATADGVVESVTTNDNGTKTIIIKHSKSLASKYIGLDIVGIIPGDVIESGQEIGTGKSGSEIYFYVLKNTEPITNLKLSDNKIIWQD